MAQSYKSRYKARFLELRVLRRKRGGKFGWTKELKDAATFSSYQQAELARLMMLHCRMPFRGKIEEAFDIGIVVGQQMAAYKAHQTMQRKGTSYGISNYVTFYDGDYFDEEESEDLSLARA